MYILSGQTLATAGWFRPETMSLNLEERKSTATVTAGPSAPEIQVGAWLRDDTSPGNGIVWRVKSVETQYNTETRTIQLEHIVNTLRDAVMFGEVKPETMGGSNGTVTAKKAVQYILGQTDLWTLGTFDSDYSSVSNPYSFNGDDLFKALETVTSSLEDAYWDYNLSTVPFKLSIRKASSDVDSEMRMSRNIQTIRRIVDRSRMYTRIYPIGQNNLHITGDYLSKHENTYGTISKVETENSKTTEAELRRWAQERLDRHCDPAVTVTVNGLDLSRDTGEALDAITLNRKCRVPLPEFGTTITEKVTKLSWSDKMKEPDKMTVTLANNREDIASIINRQTAAGSSGARASAKKESEDHAWFVDTTDHVGMVAEAIIGHDDQGVDWSRVASVIVDGGGINARVTETEGDVVTMEARIEVESNRIGLLVTGSGDSATVNRAAIVASINHGSSNVTIEADEIDINGIVSSLQAKDVMVANFNAADGEFTGDLSVLGDAAVAGDIECNGGTVSALAVTADTITSDAYYVGEHALNVTDAEVSSDNEVLTIYKTDGTSINFSKAVARNAVRVTGPTWSTAPAEEPSTNSNTATFTTDAPSPSGSTPKSLVLLLSRSDDWAGNSRTVYLSHTDSISTNRIAKITVDASPIYTAGKNSAKVTGPTWSTSPSATPSTNTNTATFTTDATTPSGSTPKSLVLLLSRSDDWVNNVRTVYLSHTNSTETNRVAKIDVDASSVFTAGKNSAKVTGPTWSVAPVSEPSSNSNTATFTTDATSPSGSTPKSLVLTLSRSDSWNGNVRTVYLSHTDSTAANRVAKITVDASDRYTAGKNAAQVTGPTWSVAPATEPSSNSNTATFTTDATTPSGSTPKSIVLTLSRSDSWSNNVRTVYLSHTNTTASNRIAKITVDAGDLVTAARRQGRVDVTLLDPVWNTPSGGQISASRTVTVWTTGRTDTSGAEANLSRGVALYLVQGSWSSNQITVSLKTGSTSGTEVAKTTVDASSLVTAARRQGRVDVTLLDPVWNTPSGGQISASRTVTVWTTGRTDTSGAEANLSRGVALYLVQGSWSSNQITVSLKTGSTSGTEVAKTTVDASGIYTAGQNDTNINSPGWAKSASAGNLDDTNTMTLTTDAPTPASKVYVFAMETDEDWSASNKMTVRVRQRAASSSSGGTSICKIDVDCTDPINTAITAATPGIKNSVKVKPFTANEISGDYPDHRTFTYTTDAPNPPSSAKQVDKWYLTGGTSWSNGQTNVYMRYGSNTGTVYAKLPVSAPALSWSCSNAMSTSSTEPTGTFEKSYIVSSAYAWAYFTVTVNGESKRYKIHIT